MAECISRFIFSIVEHDNSHNRLLEQFIPFAEGIVFAPEVTSDSEDLKAADIRNVKGTIATTVLVFMKQSCDKFQSDQAFYAITFPQLDRLCVVLLKLLGTLEKLTADCDPLIQVCTNSVIP